LIRGDAFELSLPVGFRGSADLDEVRLLLGQDFKPASAGAFDQMIRSLRDSGGFALFAYDLEEPLLQDTILIHALPTGASLGSLKKKYLHDATSDGGEIREVAEAHVGSLEAIRVIVDDPAVPLRTLTFLIAESDTWWTLEYSAPTEKFELLLPDYERSAQTFLPRAGGQPKPDEGVMSAKWSVLHRDDFSDPSSGWVVSDDATSRTRYVRGTFEVLARRAKVAHFLDLDTPNSTDAISVELEASKAMPDTPDAWLGVTCSVHDDGRYVFAIDPNAGTYTIVRYAPSAAAPVGLDFGHLPTGTIRRNDSNDLRADCVFDPASEDTNLRFSVNGSQVPSVEDANGLGGFSGIGIFISSFRGGTVASFDNLVVRGQRS
jgi:hypothetical protein